jgi:hypothetical protein
MLTEHDPDHRHHGATYTEPELREAMKWLPDIPFRSSGFYPAAVEVRGTMAAAEGLKKALIKKGWIAVDKATSRAHWRYRKVNYGATLKGRR